MRSRSFLSRNVKWWRGLCACAVLFVGGFASPARAQFFFKVYPYGTPDAGAVEVSYWTTYIASSDGTLAYFGDTVSREGLWAHSIELEYGLSHKFAVGYYADFLDPEDAGFRYFRSKLLARYRLFEKHELPVDIALYGEYILPDRGFSDAERIEFRLIIEKDFGPWRLIFNPIFEKVVSGEQVDEGLEFGYAAGIYYENLGDGLWQTRNLHIVPGVEFYGGVGELTAAGRWDQRRHYVFPVIDLFAPFYGDWKLHWNFGPGFGISDAADDVVIKSILTLEFVF
jgi:hypothetical protein